VLEGVDGVRRRAPPEEELGVDQLLQSVAQAVL
jgi:hypothetical protein